MSEELKNCDCGEPALEVEKAISYPKRDDRPTYGEVFIGKYITCENRCRYLTREEWQEYPRLTEQKKAEIVANMWGEYFCENGSVTSQEPTSKFLHWIEEKAKGER